MATISMRKVYGALLAIGLLAGAPWAFGHALYTDSEPAGGNTVQTGTLDLVASPSSAVISYDNMAPGHVATAPLSLSNGGSLELRHSMTTLVTGSAVLADGIVLRVKSGVVDCTDAGFASSGTAVYSGALSAARFGDATQGHHPGDRILAAGSDETLCLQAELPIDAGNEMQGLSATATFVFDAEQTANNA